MNRGLFLIISVALIFSFYACAGVNSKKGEDIDQKKEALELKKVEKAKKSLKEKKSVEEKKKVKQKSKEVKKTTKKKAVKVKKHAKKDKPAQKKSAQEVKSTQRKKSAKKDLPSDEKLQEQEKELVLWEELPEEREGLKEKVPAQKKLAVVVEEPVEKKVPIVKIKLMQESESELAEVEEPAPVKAPVIGEVIIWEDGRKEILVARDIVRGRVALTRWCGKNALLFEVENSGVEHINFLNKKRVKISEEKDIGNPLNCTQNGKWVLYESSENLRHDPAYVQKEGQSDGWTGSVADLVAYEVRTGRREKISEVRYDGVYDAFSPNGKLLLLGAKNSFASELYVTDWKGLWLTKDWVVEEAKWLPDSSGVVLWSNNPRRVCVEVFGSKGGKGWTKCVGVAKEDKKKITSLEIDKKKRIYFRTDKSYRCDIAGRNLSCKTIDKRQDITQFFYLNDGGRVPREQEDDCVRYIPKGESEEKCFFGTRFGDQAYDSVNLTGLSPNGRWLVFERSKQITKSYGEFSHWQYDLFVIDMKSK
jgi:hypothetical protein